LIIFTIALTGGGVVLLIFSNGLGIILLLAGVLAMLVVAGGVGVGVGRPSGQVGGLNSMRREEVREKEEGRKRRTGEED
jgi:hypothetical protein